MSNNIKKKKQFIDVNFYKTFLDLLKFYCPYYKNMDKDVKFSIGQKLYDLILESIILNIDSYYEDNIKIKYDYSLKCYNNILKIECFIRLLNDLKYLSIDQCANLSKYTAEIKIGLSNWKKSLENKLQ